MTPFVYDARVWCGVIIEKGRHRGLVRADAGQKCQWFGVT